MEISIAAEKVFEGIALPITNTFLLSFLIFIGLFGSIYFVFRKAKLFPSKIQNFFEWIFETFLDYVDSVVGDREKTREIFPLAFTLFVVVLLANLIELIPGLGVFHILRSPSSDLNFTLALAVFSMGLVHFYAIRRLKFKHYIKKYVSKNPVFMFVGSLEGVSEVTKVLSLSVRLFGNLFAGETLLIVSAHLFSFLFPLPFLLLEVLVSFVQALIFSSLIVIFYLSATAIAEH